MGLVVGVASVVIGQTIEWLQGHIWRGDHLLEAAMNLPWPWRVAIPALGGLIVGLIGWSLHMETRGGGTAATIQALALKGGLISLRDALCRTGAAIVTLATGGSLGREGPMAMLGSGIGSKLGRHFKLQPQH